MDTSKRNKDQDNHDHDPDHIKEASDEEDEHMFNEKLQCRFYRKDFPEENDLVIVITSIPTLMCIDPSY